MLKDFYYQMIQHKKGLTFNVVFALFYVLPIILANIYYIDDLGRIEEGYGLNGPGRYFATIFMKLLVSLNINFAYNIYPFSIFISAIIYAVVGYAICLLFGIEKSREIKLSSLLLLTSPFLLENLSYRYDSLTMSLSVFFVVLPFVYKSTKIRFFLSASVCLFLAFGTYQIASMCFLILLLLEMLNHFMQHKYKEGFMVGGIGALSFITAYVFYKILLIVAKADLGNQAAIITFDHEFFSKLSNSFLGYIQLIKDLMNSNNYAIFFGLFTLLALIGISNRSKKEKSLLTSLVNTSLIFLIFGAMFIITAGINLVVNTPKWFPRVMMGFPFLLLALAFLQENNTGWIRKFNRFTIILLLYFSVVLSAQYGTFLRNQDRFSEYIISLLAPKIAEHDNVKITSNGRIPYANQNKLLVAKFPLLRDLAPVYENGHWIWGLRSYNRYGMIEADYKFTPEKYDFQDMQLIDANKYYHLYYKDQLFVVDYKKESTVISKP